MIDLFTNILAFDTNFNSISAISWCELVCWEWFHINGLQKRKKKI